MSPESSPQSAPHDRRLTVCFVSHSGDHGGAQLSMLELIDGLTARGVDCRVVLPEDGVVAAALQRRRVPHLMYRFRRWATGAPRSRWDRVLKKPLVHVWRGAKLARLIRGWDCDVVVTNTITVCEGALAAALLGLPHVTHAREYGDLDHGLHFEFGPRLSVRILHGLSARFVFNSAALARYYAREVPARYSTVIYNAVSDVGQPRSPGAAATGSGVDEEAFECVLVGSLAPGKGHEEAIRAIEVLRRRGLVVRLKIVGAFGPAGYERSLWELSEVLGIRGQVEMTGHVVEPWSFFRRADVALMCSRMEAFGRVTVEAMKVGTPVIGARSGGTPEIVRDGVNGLLYSPGDAEDLADKIELLARDRASVRAMGERARLFATEVFNLERHVGEFLQVLRDVTRTPVHHGKIWLVLGWMASVPSRISRRAAQGSGGHRSSSTKAP